MSKKEILLSEGDISRLIEMAWEDRTPFEAILKTYQLDESSLMRISQLIKKFMSLDFQTRRF